ncbi:hypothetical protein [Synechococcus sp. CC9616]|uniref:hypothetical protein n=1 Tax=Synechococcus sp. CC9616 TaxID=110663 RepID=UPI0004B8C3B5|nr:hypothetical protein [Synechococcus sp. CC9616]
MIDQPFRSSSELKQFCRTIGYRCRITQFTPGPLQGRLRASKTLGFPVVRIDSSQGLIFQGDRNSAVTQIAVELNQDLEPHLVKCKRC